MYFDNLYIIYLLELGNKISVAVVYCAIQIIGKTTLLNRVVHKKKSYQHRFCDSWLNNKEYRPWLVSSKKSICFEDNKGGISAVKKHMGTMKHQRAAKSVSGTSSISEMNQQMLSRTTTIAMFVTEHNILFNTTDHLVELLKSINPEVISKLSCNRTKATAIVKNVLGATGFDNLVAKIKNQQFSMIIDESTDKTDTKHLAIVVRLLDGNVYEVRDEVKEEYLNNTDIEKVQYRLPANFVSPENIYVGGEMEFPLLMKLKQI
ncbi:E3 SUMO-protein ligase KIAA1586-like, partial [Aphis craccivora]